MREGAAEQEPHPREGRGSAPRRERRRGGYIVDTRGGYTIVARGGYIVLLLRTGAELESGVRFRIGAGAEPPFRRGGPERFQKVQLVAVERGVDPEESLPAAKRRIHRIHNEGRDSQR